MDFFSLLTMKGFLGGPYGGGVSSWNDLTDKPFGSEVKEILPEITVEIDPESGMGVIPVDFTVEGGKEYTVTYNGVEYVTNCVEMGGMFVLGNAGVLGEDVPMTTEPFCVAYAPSEFDENDEPISWAWAVGALDGSASVTLSINGEVVTKIHPKFVDHTLWVDVYEHRDDNYLSYTTSVTYGQVKKAFANGQPITARLWSEDNSVYFVHLSKTMVTDGTLVPYVLTFGNTGSGTFLMLYVDAQNLTDDTVYSVNNT